MRGINLMRYPPSTNNNFFNNFGAFSKTFKKRARSQWKEVYLCTAVKMTTGRGAKSETKVEGISLSGLQLNSLLHFLGQSYFAHYPTYLKNIKSTWNQNEMIITQCIFLSVSYFNCQKSRKTDRLVVVVVGGLSMLTFSLIVKYPFF